jgi:hypothetical protein
MISFKREGAQAVTLEGNDADFKSLLKSVERASQPDQKTNVTFRVIDEATGQHMNLILRRGKSKDSL